MRVIGLIGVWYMLHTFSLAVLLSGVWWLLSGYTLVLIIGLGIGSVILVLYICHRMDAIDHETHPVHLAAGCITYYPWLLWEIVLANWDVAKAILKNDDTVRPRLMHVKASQVSEVGRVTYANSITLTPGTVTLDIEGADLLIHSLTQGSKEGLETGEMDRRVTALELGKGGPSAFSQPALHDHPEDTSVKRDSET